MRGTLKRPLQRFDPPSPPSSAGRILLDHSVAAGRIVASSTERSLQGGKRPKNVGRIVASSTERSRQGGERAGNVGLSVGLMSDR